MDPALLRERELFKQRALATPVVETKKRKEDSNDLNNSLKKARPSSFSTSSSGRSNSINAVGTASAYKFGVLTKIVKHLRQKFQEGEDHPLNIDELLDETNQLDVSNKVRLWLESEALPQNPKVERNFEGKYVFKPTLPCRDKRSLLKLLKRHDMKGLGGIYRDDVIESVPNAERVLKNLEADIITVVRQDKKRILFYNDKHSNLQVDEEFQKLWRSVAVDGIDDDKIEEYLDKQGIRSMQDQGVKKKIQPPKRKKPNRKKQFKKPKDNEHIADVLETYDE